MQPTRPLFYIIALLLPLLILLLTEISLRLAGYGSSYPLFVPSNKSSGYLEPNPLLIQRYFAPNQAPALSMDTQLILQTKPTDSFRIVVQGGSTAAGFPYGRWGSLQAMLQQRFKRHYPDKHIEVINTAMAAINSYSLLDFQADILALQPDLVLVYAGHNEFLGILGAGSAMRVADSRAGTLLYLKLRRLRLFQLMQQMLSLFAAPVAEQKQQQRSLMAQIAQGADISRDSALYQATLAQYHANMTLLVQGYKQHKVPVMLGTLVSNERDLVPFSALSLTNWPATLEALQLNPAAEPPAAVLHHAAGSAFIRGRQALRQGDNTSALSLLQQARDEDSLRFRAPTEFNVLLRGIASTEQLTVVDVEQHFRRYSKAGVIGNSLLLEHVHPNTDGYLLLADAFYRAIAQSGLLGQAEAGDTLQPQLDLPLTELDIRYATLKINNLLRQYPFSQPELAALPFVERDALDKLLRQRLQNADWLNVQQTLAQFFLDAKDADNAVKVMAMLADAMPFDSGLWQDTGLFYLQLQQLPLANYYLAAALRQQPDNLRYLLNMAQLRFMQQRLDDSLQLLLQAQQLAPQDKRTQQFIAKVRLALANTGLPVKN